LQSGSGFSLPSIQDICRALPVRFWAKQPNSPFFPGATLAPKDLQDQTIFLYSLQPGLV